MYYFPYSKSFNLSESPCPISSFLITHVPYSGFNLANLDFKNDETRSHIYFAGLIPIISKLLKQPDSRSIIGFSNVSSLKRGYICSSHGSTSLLSLSCLFLHIYTFFRAKNIRRYSNTCMVCCALGVLLVYEEGEGYFQTQINVIERA